MDAKSKNIKSIIDCGLIPIVRTESPEQAMSIVSAIREGGVMIIEITMTVPGALKLMEEVTSRYGGDALLGAGTVLDGETARAAILAGAEFIVSPQLNLDVIKVAKRYSKIVVPGALTPTEVVTAWEAGADFVKIFPADAVGGPKYIKALKAPLPQIEFIPTGGVNLGTAGDFIKAGASALGVGSSLVDKQAIAERKFDVLTANAKKFVEEIKKARVEEAEERGSMGAEE